MCKLYSECASKRGKTGIEWQKIIDAGDDSSTFTADQVLNMGLADEVT